MSASADPPYIEYEQGYHNGYTDGFADASGEAIAEYLGAFQIAAHSSKQANPAAKVHVYSDIIQPMTGSSSSYLLPHHRISDFTPEINLSFPLRLFHNGPDSQHAVPF